MFPGLGRSDTVEKSSRTTRLLHLSWLHSQYPQTALPGMAASMGWSVVPSTTPAAALYSEAVSFLEQANVGLFLFWALAETPNWNLVDWHQAWNDAPSHTSTAEQEPSLSVPQCPSVSLSVPQCPCALDSHSNPPTWSFLVSFSLQTQNVKHLSFITAPPALPL